MSFDNSRFTFDPRKNYSGVVMEQGRVQLDSDWNEGLAENARRIQAGTLDLFGHAAYPSTTPSAFLITATSGSPNTVTIGCGRMYVDGLLAENHGDPANAVWDPALAELSGAPQPPDPANPNPNPISYINQPWLPGAVAPTDTGSYLAYLDVWTRAVDYLEDPSLVDKAVGVDTTGRLQTVWQVKLMANTDGWNCQTPDSQIPYPPSSAGQLTSDVAPNTTAGPCCLTDGSGYTGQENQFYRVEIHQSGQPSDTPTASTASFKWSPDNASVETGVTAINSVHNSVGAMASQLTVLSLGRDQVLGFKNGDWIELLDDWSELWGNPGVLCQIDSVSFPNKTITLTGTVDTTAAPPGPGIPANFPLLNGNLTDPARHTRIRRWNQSGLVLDIHGNQWCDLSLTGGLIPVPATKTLVLENGITVAFGLSSSSGQFNVADFWTFAARTADGSVEKLKAAPPRGIHHHYTKLSVVTFSSPASYTNCRTPFPTAAADCGCCCTATVGDNLNSFGKYSKIQDAINSLPTTGPIIGGEVCILPGRYYEHITLANLTNVVLHGCGSQTRLASPTMRPVQTEVAKAKGKSKPPTSLDTAGSGPTPESGFSAIVTIIGSSNIELRDFAIEAADDEAGILLDGTSPFNHNKYTKKMPTHQGPGKGSGSGTDVTDFPFNISIHDLAITASTMPAILAVDTSLLNIRNNRIAMKDSPSQWASLYASGSEIHIADNWIGLADTSAANEWMPPSVIADLPDSFSSANAPATPLANGGIHIGGPSQDVYILNNAIEGGSRNGISLGSFAIVDAKNVDSGIVTGLLVAAPDPAATTATLKLPATTSVGNSKGQVVAGGVLQNIQIANNRIRNMGLCGIGPVGFFNLDESNEIITIQNLSIASNTIAGTLQDQLAPLAGAESLHSGYGAICLPDVQNVILRDNTVTDFGAQPGAEVCGIFVFNAEQIEISRNRVLETRDWTAIPATPEPINTGARAGIAIFSVTPPTLNQLTTASAWASSNESGSGIPICQPGLPALRVLENVVRVPLGLALNVVGLGPFAIQNNQFSSGGTIPVTTAGISIQPTNFKGRSLGLFLTVMIENLGAAIEVDAAGASFASLFGNGQPASLTVADSALSASSSGAIQFTNNIVQLETRASGVQGIASVAILTHDHLIFSNNHLWIDGLATAVMDALLIAASLQVTENRLQEGKGTVAVSGLSYGISNITTHNTSTHCLFRIGVPALSILTPNVAFDSGLCADLYKR